MPAIKMNGVTYAGNMYDTQPVGEIIQFSGDGIPAGYVELTDERQSVLRSDYPTLFKKIGTKYGAEDDLHFNLPAASEVDTVSSAQLNDALTDYCEVGENEKGYYRKWANGTLEQWGVKRIENSLTNLLTFPIPFKDADYSFTAIQKGVTSGLSSSGFVATSDYTNANINVLFYDSRQTSVLSGNASWFAIGKWK